MSDAIAPVEIRIPYKPRNWAREMHGCLKRFFAVVLHRRAGKTTAVINHHERYAMDDALERRRLLYLKPDLDPKQLQELIHPPGGRQYAHILPTYNQAERVAWKMAQHYSSPIPGLKVNQAKLSIRYPTGHSLQLFGADNPDSLRGWAGSGVSFDEYSQQPSNIYSEIISKALGDHLGYAIFLGTIKGRDQLWDTYQAAKGSDDWFSLWQDVDRSLATEDGITLQLLERAMEDDRKQIALGLMTQDEYDQEWFLSADAAIKGAWFLKEMSAARAQGRITRVPIDRALPVDTDWDLGIADSMSIWFSQSLRSGEVRLVDYYEASGEGFPHYIGVLKEKGYVYGKHYPPHDIAVRELSSGKSRKEIAKGLGLTFQEPMPAIELPDGINAVRLLLAQCWFDEEKCARGIECLRQYRKSFNTRLDEFTGTPVHNWACVTGDTKVLTRSGTYQIQYLPETGEVLTPCGWKAYEQPRRTRRNAPLVEVAFEDGLTVRCTPDHLFLTDSGWSYARDLLMGSEIQSSWTRSSSISMGASIASGLKSVISRVAGSISIGRFGLVRLERFRAGATSIIATETLSITPWPIWSAYPPLSTSLRIGDGIISASLTRLAQRLALALPSGTDLRLGDSGIDDKRFGARVGKSGSENHAPANTAAQSSLMRWFASKVTRRNTARKLVRPLRIARVTPLSERSDVWCLTVPDGHVWSLENGAVTHNSHGADAFRGLAVRYKRPAAPRERTWPTRTGRTDGPMSWAG